MKSSDLTLFCVPHWEKVLMKSFSYRLWIFSAVMSLFWPIGATDLRLWDADRRYDYGPDRRNHSSNTDRDIGSEYSE